MRKMIMAYLLKTLTDDEIVRIGKALGVDYSHTTWKEEKHMIIEDYCAGLVEVE